MIIINYLIMCFIFGTTFLAIKIGIDAGTPPFFVAGVRFFLAGAILLVVMVLKKKASLSLLLRKEMMLTGLGLTFGTFASLYWAEQFIPSGIAAVLSATGPIMILLMQAFLLREKATTKSLIGCFVGFLGVTILLLPSLSFKVSLFWLLGSIVILIGEVFYASGTLYSRHVIKTFKETSPIGLNAAQMIYGGLFLLIFSMFTESNQLESILNIHAVGSLLYLIVFGSMVGHSIYYWLVANTNPVFPSTWLYVSPIIAMIIGAFFYNESISFFMVIGGITIIFGIVLINLDAIRGLFKKTKVFEMMPNSKKTIKSRS